MDVVDHIAHIKFPCFSRQFRMKHHLQQQVPQFRGKFLPRSSINASSTSYASSIKNGRSDS